VLFAERLHRDAPIERHLMPEVDDPHAAFAERLVDT
jgi:hypothetical protein